MHAASFTVLFHLMVLIGFGIFGFLQPFKSRASPGGFVFGLWDHGSQRDALWALQQHTIAAGENCGS